MRKPKNKQIIALILISIILGFVAIYYFTNRPSGKIKKPSVKNINENVFKEPQFRKDGELSFFSGEKKKKTISIEIVDTEAARNQGLMYRKSMPDSCGMLFVFDYMQPLSFWMKNTHISLDIIYIDDKFRIVSIARNTVPFSEASIPSEKDGMYVVEVNAGFCEKYNIKENDIINFTTH